MKKGASQAPALWEKGRVSLIQASFSSSLFHPVSSLALSPPFRGDYVQSDSPFLSDTLMKHYYENLCKNVFSLMISRYDTHSLDRNL
jgi:hypothetical protein